MIEAKYDAIAQEYHEIAKASFHNPQSIGGLASQALIQAVGAVHGKSLCDLGCGDGQLVNYFHEAGANVTGIDLSEKLLLLAKEQFPELRFQQDDAQSLGSIADSSFEIVISNFALMDIPDLSAVYRSVWRILQRNGRFIFTITHPCFQAPHSDNLQEADKFIGRVVQQYRQEGAWQSSYSQGIRGRVGAHHRQISTYLNGLVQAGFGLESFAEPCLPAGDYASVFQQSMAAIPSIFLIHAKKNEE